MSRYACNLFRNGKLIDDNSIIGFAEPMHTFFFHSGEEDELGQLRIWVGLEYRQFKTFTEMLELFKAHGCELQVWESEWQWLRKETSQEDYEKARQMTIPWSTKK